MTVSARRSIRSLVLRTREEAKAELERIGVDPVGTAIMAPKQFHRTLMMRSLTPPQANILKQEILALGGEAAVSKGVVACRVETTDCILSGTDKQLGLLIKKLAAQPYGLGEVAVELRGVLKNLAGGEILFKGRTREWTLGRETLIMGVLNVTPDSFSDGGRYMDLSAAVERAVEMADEGAHIIDVGGESSRPGATAVSVEEELKRVVPLVEELVKKGLAVSIDTMKVAVADEALKAGAEVINDITAFGDPAMASVVSSHRAGVILMHMRGAPSVMQDDVRYGDLMGEVYDYLFDAVETAKAEGVGEEHIAIDPGIGFGKSARGSLEILGRLAELRSIGRPVMVGTSRKSFIGEVTGGDVDERLAGTLASVAVSVMNGAGMVRVHDVAEAVAAVKVADAVRRRAPEGEAV